MDKDKRREYDRNYYHAHKDKAIEKRKRYLSKEDKLEKRKISIKKWKASNKERVSIRNKEYHKNRFNNDEDFVLLLRLRANFRKAMKKSIEGKIQSSKKYGINYKAIIDHLGPCPGKREDYHIDHILPLSAFNFNDPIHIIAAFSPENHQWLLKEDNLSKNNKYNKNDFDNYIKKFVPEELSNGLQ